MEKSIPTNLMDDDYFSIYLGITIYVISPLQHIIKKSPRSAEKLLHGAAVSSPSQQGTLLSELEHLMKSDEWDVIFLQISWKS